MPVLKTGYTPQVDAKLTSDGYEVKRQYAVTVQDNETGSDVELNVLNTNGLPSIGDSLSNAYPNVLCTSVDCSPADNGNDDGDFLTWYVDATFKTPADTDDPNDGAINPTVEKPVVSFGATQYERVVDKSYKSGDRVGKPTRPIENSVGDPYDPPITVTYSNQYIQIQQNLNTFNPDWILQYENTVNKSSLTIVGVDVAPYQARLISIRGSNAVDSNGKEYWVVSYEFEINKEGFAKRILNAGLNFKKDGVGKVPIKYKDLPDFEGTEEEGEDFVSEPQKLNADGALVPVGAPAFYRDEFIYFAESWVSLSIPAQV